MTASRPASHALGTLVVVRAVHTAIYVVMSAATVALLYVGLRGQHAVWLWIALPLLAGETLIFTASGFKCPLTAIVDRQAGPDSHVPDTLLPEAFTRHTLIIFGPLLLGALSLVVVRWAGLFGLDLS